MTASKSDILHEAKYSVNLWVSRSNVTALWEKSKTALQKASGRGQSLPKHSLSCGALGDMLSSRRGD